MSVCNSGRTGLRGVQIARQANGAPEYVDELPSRRDVREMHYVFRRPAGLKGWLA